jgi:putative redox protein
MIAKTIWKKEMEFEGHSESGHTIPFDGDVAHAYGASPMEAVLMRFAPARRSTLSRS